MRFATIRRRYPAIHRLLVDDIHKLVTTRPPIKKLPSKLINWQKLSHITSHSHNTHVRNCNKTFIEIFKNE